MNFPEQSKNVTYLLVGNCKGRSNLEVLSPTFTSMLITLCVGKSSIRGENPVTNLTRKNGKKYLLAYDPGTGGDKAILTGLEG